MTWHPDMPVEYRDAIVTGDSRELATRIPDESVDLVLTDPPFGIGFDYEGYTDDPAEYAKLVAWIAKECDRIIKPGGLCFVFQAQLRLRLTWPLFPDDSRIFAACKNFVQMRPTPVQYAYDPVVFWQKLGPRLLPVYRGRDYYIGNTANTNNRGANEAGWHECPRPLDTCLYIVDSYSPPGGVVADFFMGSGTTAIAAKQTGRHFVGFEIREDIAERAQRRSQKAQPPLLVLDPEQLPLAV